MIFCPASGNWCNLYAFDKDYKLTCDCECLEKDKELTVKDCGGVLFEE